MIEAALSGNARVQIDISSVHGLGTVFDRKIEAGVYWAPGQSPVLGRTNIFVDWSEHPAKTREWFERSRVQELKARLSRPNGLEPPLTRISSFISKMMAYGARALMWPMAAAI
jgi:hypothetical protein